MPERLAKKVLLIGWDAADWKHINPLLEKGWMPTLQKFMVEGVWGNSATLNPILSPMLWNSIATGKRPYKHGIHGFIEPMPDGKGVRPSSSTTRKCKAIWNILTQQGYKTHQVGWFCSHPAEPINGVYVTNMYDRVTAQKPEDWKLPDGAVHPADLAAVLGELRLHPSELHEAQIAPFIPNAAKINQDKDRRLSSFAKLLCEMVNLHSATTWIMENREWDFIATYNPAIDHFSHGFMRYHPPRMKNVREEDFEIYKDIITGVYRFHDMMLDRMLQLAGPETTVVICSDHGFHSDHLRPLAMPHEPAGPAVWHREYGIVAMKGPGVKKNERVYGATVLDITPTVLTLFGLPVASDMDGKPLVQGLEVQSAWIERIESWEKEEGEAGMHPADKREDPFEAREAIQQLVDLGYIEKPDENAEKAAAQADREAKYNLARAYLDGGLVNEATELLAKLWEEHPNELRFGLNLAQCYLTSRKRSEARGVIEQLLDRAQKQAAETVVQLEKRREAMHQRAADEAAGKVAPPEAVKAGGQRGRRRKRQADKITPEMLQRMDHRIDKMQERLRDTDVRVAPRAQFMLGVLELHEKKLEKAMEHLQAAEQSEPRLPGLHVQIGRAYLRMKRPEDALRAFRKALVIDGDSALAHDGIAASCLRLGKPTAAAEHALIAVGLLHHLPRTHLRLGLALARLRMYDRAAEALQTCIKLAPMMIAPHRVLARLYRERLQRPDLAAEHLSKIDFIRASLRKRA